MSARDELLAHIRLARDAADAFRSLSPEEVEAWDRRWIELLVKLIQEEAPK